MADTVSTTAYGLANQVDPADEYKKGLTASIDAQLKPMALTQAKQDFSDQQASRQAMQQSVGPNGQVDDNLLKNTQLYKQNPMMAQNLSNSMKEIGLKGTALKIQDLQGAYSRINDEDSFQREKQNAIDNGHPEAANWPDHFTPSFQRQGLINTMTADQHLAQYSAQQKMAFDAYQKIIESGKMPPDELRQAAGLPAPGQPPAHAVEAEGSKKAPYLGNLGGVRPGDTIPGSKLDREALDAYDKEIAGRGQNDPAYAQAGNNLLAVNNAMAVFNKYKNLNDVNTTDQHILAMEGAKAMKGGASPTEDEVNALMPHNGFSLAGEAMARTLGRPMPANNAEHWQMLKDYFGDLRDNSVNHIKSAHDEAYKTSLLHGANPMTAKEKYKAAMQEIQSKAYGRGSKSSASGHPQSQEALEWANNPRAPGWTREKADAIKQAVGGGN
jgi:hypothetical protein